MYKYAIVHIDTEIVSAYFQDLQNFIQRRPADLYWTDEYALYEYVDGTWNKIPKPGREVYNIIVTGPFGYETKYIFDNIEAAENCILQFPDGIARMETVA